MNTTRRGFLGWLGIGAAATAASAVLPAVVLAEPEPVRRYWQVGAKLGSSSLDEYYRNLASGDPNGGMQAIEGQPGLFRDAQGNIYNIKRFIHDEYTVEPAITFEPPVWVPPEKIVTEMPINIQSYMHGILKYPQGGPVTR